MVAQRQFSRAGCSAAYFATIQVILQQEKRHFLAILGLRII
jgi:hypothetical protein